MARSEGEWSEEITRRELFQRAPRKVAQVLALYETVMSFVPSIATSAIQATISEGETAGNHLPPSPQLGFSYNPRSIEYFNLDPKKTRRELLALPWAGRVRIAIPFDEVAREKGKWDITTREKEVEEAVAKGKKIDLQLGIKTFGWPEIHAPAWLTQAYPYLLQKSAQVDKDPSVQEIILEYLDRTAEHYLQYPGIKSIHVENEAFSRRLPVTRYRYVSTGFNLQEVAQVQQHNKDGVPTLQNFPFDTPEAIPFVLAHSNIIGLNIYNQYNGMTIPEGLQWWLVGNAFRISRVLKKKVFVTEYQAAAWLNVDKEPVSPFTADKRLAGFQRLQKQKPDAILLWDLEQLIWLSLRGKPGLDSLSNMFGQGI